MKSIFSFPNPVNEAAARLVALGVVSLSVLTLTTGWAWLLYPLTFGFLARTAAGPRFSPLGRLAVYLGSRHFVSWQRFVAGPPKRFAQSIGLAITLAATLTWWFAGWSNARWLLLPLVLAASLEGFAGWCLGCTLFSGLIRMGLVPDSVCQECSDLSARYRRAGVTIPSSPSE